MNNKFTFNVIEKNQTNDVKKMKKSISDIINKLITRQFSNLKL